MENQKDNGLDFSFIDQAIAQIEKRQAKIQDRGFSIEAGVKTAQDQIVFYAKQVDYAAGQDQMYAFVKEASEMVKAKIMTANSGYDIPRGTAIEALAWKYKGKTAAEYNEFLQSLD